MAAPFHPAVVAGIAAAVAFGPVGPAIAQLATESAANTALLAPLPGAIAANTASIAANTAAINALTVNVNALTVNVNALTAAVAALNIPVIAAGAAALHPRARGKRA